MKNSKKLATAIYRELGDTGICVDKEKLLEKAKAWQEKPRKERSDDLITLGTAGLVLSAAIIGAGLLLGNGGN